MVAIVFRLIIYVHQHVLLRNLYIALDYYSRSLEPTIFGAPYTSRVRRVSRVRKYFSLSQLLLQLSPHSNFVLVTAACRRG